MDRKEKSLVRIGGLGGILFLVILGFAVSFLWRTPFVRTQRMEEILIGIYSDRTSFFIAQTSFVVLCLLALLVFFALYMVLKKDDPGYAILGCAFGATSFIMLGVHSSMLLSSYLSLADQYVATPIVSRDAVVRVAEAILGHGLAGGILDGLLFLAYVFTIIAYVALGWGMMNSTVFRNGDAWFTLGLGVMLAILMIAYFTSPFGFVIYSTGFLLGAWFTLVGRRLYNLAKQ